MKLLKLGFIVLVLAWLSACGTMSGAEKGSASKGGVAVEDQSAESAGVPGENVEGKDMGQAEAKVVVGEKQYQGDELSNPDSPLSKRVVYFDYDSSTIRPEDQPILEAHAAYLADHPKATVRLEGNTDERGSREYNLALGERRAIAVRQILMLQGAGIHQFEIVSYGEERPVDDGHDEAAWAKNRRVEIVYTSTGK